MQIILFGDKVILEDAVEKYDYFDYFFFLYKVEVVVVFFLMEMATILY